VLTKTNIVEEFIKDYQRSRVVAIASVRATMNRALEFEKKFNKAFYEFTEDEVIEMYKSVDAISARSLQNLNLTLKHAARWMLHNQKKDIGNVYDKITKDLIQECVNTTKREGLILSREQLTEIQNELLNDTDKAILELLFLGVGGHWLKELTFFNMSQVDRKEALIYFRTGKTISIDEETYDLIKRACSEDELISFGETMRISRVQSYGIFKKRANALSASDNLNDERDLERRFRFIQRRLLLMSKEFGVQLTSGNLQASGLLYMLQQGVKETGLSFREYVKTEEAGKLARQYDLYTALYPQILVERFEEYFK
jgi:hypothetical protein